MKNLITFLLLVLFISSCGSSPKNKLDSARETVFNYLDRTFPEEQKRRFRIADPELTNQEYSSIKQYAQAQLQTDDSLLSVFQKNGLGDMDILPKALADCYEDHLQDSLYNLENHYKELMERWIPVRECKKYLHETAVNYFQNYTKGDTITLIAPYYSTSSGYDIDIIEDFCGEKWEFDTREDELYHGVLLNKKISNNGKNYIFMLKVIHMNDNQNRRSGNTIKLGDEIEFKVNSPMKIKPYKGLGII